MDNNIFSSCSGFSDEVARSPSILFFQLTLPFGKAVIIYTADTGRSEGLEGGRRAEWTSLNLL